MEPRRGAHSQKEMPRTDFLGSVLRGVVRTLRNPGFLTSDRLAREKGHVPAGF